MERLVVLDTTPVRPLWMIRDMDVLLGQLRALDISKMTNREEADQLLQDKIPVSSTLSFIM